MDNDAEQTIAEALAKHSDQVREFAQDLRGFLKRETRPAYELAGQSAQSYNIGYGFTTTSWDCFCAIIVYRKHTNLSLPSGATLPDPDGIMHGTGSKVRHLKIESIADLQTPAASSLLAAARKQALFLNRDLDPDPRQIETVIKRR